MYIILIDNPGFCFFPGECNEAIIYNSKKDAMKAGKELGFPFNILRAPKVA